jgi:putative ABC transport system substrate-binding protein
MRAPAFRAGLGADQGISVGTKRATVTNRGRRNFILGAAASLAAGAFAQTPGKTYVVAYWGAWFAPGKPPEKTTALPWLEEALAKHGFVVGQNTRIEYMFTGWDTRDLIPLQAKKLVAANPDVIWPRFDLGYQKRKALLALTKSIPIVVDYWEERIAAEEVGDLKRPVGNMTGIATNYVLLSEKRLELVRQLVPKARRVAVIADYPNYPPEFFTSLVAAGQRLGLEIVRGDVSRHGCNWEATAAGGTAALDATLSSVLKARPDALMGYGSIQCAPDRARQLEDFELKHRIPNIHDGGSTGSAVGLGWDYQDHRRRAVDVVAKILKGARPADIPVEITSRLLLTVNLKRAREIGMEIPPSIMVRADRLIE